MDFIVKMSAACGICNRTDVVLASNISVCYDDLDCHRHRKGGSFVTLPPYPPPDPHPNIPFDSLTASHTNLVVGVDIRRGEVCEQLAGLDPRTVVQYTETTYTAANGKIKLLFSFDVRRKGWHWSAPEMLNGNEEYETIGPNGTYIYISQRRTQNGKICTTFKHDGASCAITSKHTRKVARYIVENWMLNIYEFEPEHVNAISVLGLRMLEPALFCSTLPPSLSP